MSVSLPPPRANAFVEIEYWRGRLDLRHLLLGGDHVVVRQIITDRGIRAGIDQAFVLRPDQVGADVLDLRQHVLLCLTARQ